MMRDVQALSTRCCESVSDKVWAPAKSALQLVGIHTRRNTLRRVPTFRRRAVRSSKGPA